MSRKCVFRFRFYFIRFKRGVPTIKFTVEMLKWLVTARYWRAAVLRSCGIVHLGHDIVYLFASFYYRGHAVNNDIGVYRVV